MWTWDCNFFDKTLHFFRVVRLNWLAKIELRGARGPWSSILLLVTVVSEKCYKETEETIGFFVTFLSLVKFQLRETRAPCPPPPWLRLCSKWGKQKRCLQIFREVSGVFQRNFNCSKNSAVLEPRTRQFSRTWGFEAKDLTFEAKDFKIRPRGLHLCKILS